MLNADAALLAELTPRERRLVQQVMDDHLTLTLAKALAMLKAAGCRFAAAEKARRDTRGAANSQPVEISALRPMKAV